jgi:hypothetical protein
MSGFSPYAQLGLWIDREFYGVCLQPRRSLSWSVPASMGTPNVTVAGLVKDPSGQYAMLQPVYIPVDSDETNWTTGGSGQVFTHGMDETTGLTYLVQKSGDIATTSWATWFQTRTSELGVLLDIWRGAPPQAPGGSPVPIDGTNWNLYVYPSVGNTYVDEPITRVSIEAGNPIHLDVSWDHGATWTVVDTAFNLGESETYLNSRDRRITLEFVPAMDKLWHLSVDTAPLKSDQPPDALYVIVNGGDAILTWRQFAGTFADGAVGIQVTGGGWTCKYIKRRHVTGATMNLPVQTRPRAMLSDPIPRMRGYQPFGGMCEVFPVAVGFGGNAFGAILQVTVPDDDIDDTGYATLTPFISTALLDFPATFQERGILTEPIIVDAFYSRDTHSFNQTNFTRRSFGEAWFVDNVGYFAPGNGIALAVRAATLTRGHTAAGGYDDGITAITGLAGRYAWQYVDKQLIVKVYLADRFQQLSPDDLGPIVEETFDGDGECHYYIQRRLGQRLGFRDEDMNFPYCGPQSPCEHYHLPRGTTYEPAFRFPAQMSVIQAMQWVRHFAGEPDYTSPYPYPLPMYLFIDNLGVMQYLPAPVGLVQTWLDPSLNPITQGIDPWKTFGGPPLYDGLGYGLLNEINVGLGSEVSLANIRTPIVLEGMRPQDGGFVLAYYNNPAQGGGPLADPWAAGYRGIDMPYTEISRNYTSQEAAEIAIQIAAVQMSFPATSCGWQSQLQSQLFPLMPVAVQDFNTQGTYNPVNYYTAYTDHVIDVNQSRAATEIRARLLGQAG